MSRIEIWIKSNPRTVVIALGIAFVTWFAVFFRYDLRAQGVYLDRWTGALYQGAHCINCD